MGLGGLTPFRRFASRTAAFASRYAWERECTGGIHDRERLSRRVRRHFDVVAVGRRSNRKGDWRTGQSRLDTSQHNEGVAAYIGAFVGETGLDRDLSTVRSLLRLGVAGLVFLVEERRQRDRGQDSEDEHDDEKLDQREAGLAIAVEPGAYFDPEILEKHQVPPMVLIVCARAPSREANWCLSTPVVARLTPEKEFRRHCAPASRRVCLLHRGTGRFITVPLIDSHSDPSIPEIGASSRQYSGSAGNPHLIGPDNP